MSHDQEIGNQVKKLISAGSHVEAGMLMSLLAESGIESYEVEKGSGNYMRIYMGYSVFGEDIYVKAEDFEAARELLASLEPGQGEIETDAAEADAAEADAAGADAIEEDAIDEEAIYEKPRKTARIILAIFLIMLLGAALSGGLLAFLQQRLM